MAEPPNPTMPGGPIDEPGDDANDWVRPSQRRPPRPRPAQPSASQPDAAPRRPAKPRASQSGGSPSGASKPGASPRRPAKPRASQPRASQAGASPRRPAKPRASQPAEPPTLADAPPPPAADDATPGDGTEAVASAGSVAATDTARTRQRRRAQHRNRRRAALSAGAIALVLAILAGVLLASGGGSSRAASPTRRAAAVTVATAPPANSAALIATTKVPSLQVFEQPAAKAKVVTTLSDKTDYLVPRTLLAIGTQPGWLQVLLPVRPNGSQGWVRASDVTTTTTDYQLRIVLSTHHLTLVKAGKPVLGTQVVLGKKETPTPTGLFYVTDPVDLQAQPHGPYGAFALGLSGFSNVLMSFNGGPGQIAVHGTPYGDQIGQDLSNGCVRIPDPLILMIAKTVPVGTPVMISA